MRLVCPNCDAQYEVDDSVIPVSGRDVQCSNCDHTWFQRPQPVLAPTPMPASSEPEPLPQVSGSEAGPVPSPKDAPAPQVTVEVDTTPGPFPEDTDTIEPETQTASASDTPAITDVFADAPEEDTPPLSDSRSLPLEADAAQNQNEDEAAPSAPMPEEQTEEDDTDLEELAEITETLARIGARKDPDDDDPPAPALQARRRPLDTAVMTVLREEAEREQRARAAEATGTVFETQPDLGLLENSATRSPLADRAEALHEGDEISNHLVHGREALPRRDLLPDIEEINSTLRATSDRQDTDPETERAAMATHGSAFGRGFTIVIALAVGLIALYAFAPDIMRTLPQSALVLEPYVAALDGARLSLDGLMHTMVERMSAK